MATQRTRMPTSPKPLKAAEPDSVKEAVEPSAALESASEAQPASGPVSIIFSTDGLVLLRHALDVMIRGEAASLNQVGVSGLQGGRAMVLAERLVMAADLERIITAEYARRTGGGG